MTDITFVYDTREAVGQPYLTPVYFENEVLIKYLYSKKAVVEFVSDTYGSVYLSEQNLPFGINRSGTIIAWLGDLQDLPIAEQYHWSLHNVGPQNDIKSEFYDAQISVEFTEPPKAVQLLNAIEKWNAAFSRKHGIHLYKHSSFDDRIDAVRRYKRLIIQSEDDFVRFVSELNEIINESVNTKTIRAFLTAKSLAFPEGAKGNKLLEVVYRDYLGDKNNIIEPFFMLYDLRLWADHDMGDEKLIDVARRLGISDKEDFAAIFELLLERLLNALTELSDNFG